MASVTEATKIANELAGEFLEDILSMSGKDFIRKYMMQDVDMKITSFDNHINVWEIRIPLMRLAYNAWFISESREIYVTDIAHQVRASAPIDVDVVGDIMDFINENIAMYFSMVVQNISINEEDE